MEDRDAGVDVADGGGIISTIIDIMIPNPRHYYSFYQKNNE